MCEQEVLYVCVCTVKLHKMNNSAYMYYKVLKYKRYRKNNIIKFVNYLLTSHIIDTM